MAEFQTKFREPLPHYRVEAFAHVLAVQAGYTRNVNDFSLVDLESQHAFREMAAEYASILGVNPFAYVILNDQGEEVVATDA